jgi:hypothetical protein
MSWAGATWYFNLFERAIVFRAFGYGFHFGWYNRPVYFSERYGYRKVHRLGRLSLEWLKPETGRARSRG